MGKIVFPATDILSVSDLIRQIAQSNANGDRFCFILGAGASVESKIPTGFDLELAWMRYLMGKEADKYEKPLPKGSYGSQAIAFLQKREPEETRRLAKRMRADKKLSHSFETILRAWKDAEKWVQAKEVKTSYTCKYNFSEYYFDIYRLRFYPDKKNGYRYLERIMEACSPSIGYHTLALLLTRTNQNNLVVTTNFDSLVEDALFLYTDKKPLVVSHESLADFIDPNLQRPIIAKVHRGLFYDPMNSPDTRLSEAWKRILDNLLAVYTPIVIGYSGSDNSLMKYLEQNEKLQQIYWCFRGSETDVPDRVKKLVLKTGGNLVAIPGFDAMMLDIGTRLYLTEMAPKSTERNQTEQLQARMTDYREKWEDWKTKNAAPEMQEQIRRMEQAERYSEIRAKAKSAYENGDMEAAVRFCTEAIHCGNDFAGDYYNRALCYQEWNRPQQALADYSKAIEMKPDYVDAYCNRGNVYHDLGQTDAALADYSKVIELKPDDAEGYYNRGNVYHDLGQTDAALADYNRAIELKPDYAEDYNNRGNVYYDLGQKDAALADYSKAIELKPDYAKAYNNRGNVYADLRQKDAALADYSKAIELKPDNAEAYYNRGILYRSLEQIDAALADFSKAIERKPDDAETYYNRGNVYADLGQKDAALADYSKAIELKPDYAEAYNNRGNVYHDLGQKDAALADFSKAIERKPDNAEAYYNRGILYRSLEQTDAALADYSKAIELKPDFEEAYYNRGNVYDDMGQKDAALADYSKAIELKPDYAEAYNNRGNVYDDMGQTDAALADYSKAIELKPDNAEAYNNRGYFCAKQGEYEQALADLQKSLQIAPEEASTLHSLGFTYMHRGREGDNALALEAFTKAIQLDGEDPQFYQDRATVYRQMGEEALAQADETKAEELRSSKA